MPYDLTHNGETTVRCGYRIMPVHDPMRDFEGVRVKSEDGEWYAAFTYAQWAWVAKLPDDQFRAELLAIRLESELGIPVRRAGADPLVEAVIAFTTARSELRTALAQADRSGVSRNEIARIASSAYSRATVLKMLAEDNGPSHAADEQAGTEN